MIDLIPTNDLFWMIPSDVTGWVRSPARTKFVVSSDR